MPTRRPPVDLRSQRRVLTAALGLTLLSGTGCTSHSGYLPLEQERLFPHISHGTVPAETAQRCHQALDSRNAYPTYRRALEELRRGSTIATIPHLGCLLPADGRERSSGDLYAQLVSEVFLPNVLNGYLQKRLGEVIAQDIQQGQRRDAGLAWPGAYLLEACVVAYRNSGETRFLDLFQQTFDQVLQRRDIHTGYRDVLRERATHGWSSINISEEKRSKHNGPPFLTGHVTHAARIVYPATEFARVVRSRPELQSRYGASADRYVAASRDAINDFNEDWQVVPGQTVPGSQRPLRWYRRPITNSLEATNHVHMVASAWLNLAQLTADPSYLQKAQDAVAIFRKGTTEKPQGFIHWNYFPFFATKERKLYSHGREYSEAIWKASLTTPFIARAGRQGLPEAKQLSTSIARAIHREVLSETNIRRNISSQDSRWFDPNDPADKKQLGKLTNVTYFLEYADLEPAIARQLRRLTAGRPDLFPRGWIGSESGALGYAHLLPAKPAPNPKP